MVDCWVRESGSCATALQIFALVIALAANHCAAQELLPGPVDSWQYRFRQEANAVRILEVVTG